MASSQASPGRSACRGNRLLRDRDCRARSAEPWRSPRLRPSPSIARLLLRGPSGAVHGACAGIVTASCGLLLVAGVRLMPQAATSPLDPPVVLAGAGPGPQRRPSPHRWSRSPACGSVSSTEAKISLPLRRVGGVLRLLGWPGKRSIRRCVSAMAGERHQSVASLRPCPREPAVADASMPAPGARQTRPWRLPSPLQCRMLTTELEYGLREAERGTILRSGPAHPDSHVCRRFDRFRWWRSSARSAPRSTRPVSRLRSWSWCAAAVSAAPLSRFS